ncbi:hypothetical protein [Streptomyces mirabilis]|uniref:hypothetical protein n=1 Tax=Streptomyces mirabilis TaxID=68239 RepID=UPI0036E53092
MDVAGNLGRACRFGRNGGRDGGRHRCLVTAAGQTLKNTKTGHCLEIASPAYGGGKQVMVATCNSDEPQQLWNNGATA